MHLSKGILKSDGDTNGAIGHELAPGHRTDHWTGQTVWRDILLGGAATTTAGNRFMEGHR